MGRPLARRGVSGSKMRVLIVARVLRAAGPQTPHIPRRRTRLSPFDPMDAWQRGGSRIGQYVVGKARRARRTRATPRGSAKRLPSNAASSERYWPWPADDFAAKT